MAVTTSGFHRIGNVTTRIMGGLQQQAIPNASIAVTLTSSGAAATIYSDPGLTVTIFGGLVTADIYGNFDYYIPLNYMVTETVSYAGGAVTTYSNIGNNGPIAASFTTTSGTSDVVSIPGMISTGHVVLFPTNSSAATLLAGGSVYVSAKAANQITVSHSGTSGATFDIVATPY